MNRILRGFASLRLTVALMAAAMVIVFVGTFAQTRMGIWHAVAMYFRSVVVWIDPFVLWPSAEGSAPFSIPFPGGLTICVLMIVNLIAAHAVRMRPGKSRGGIILLHAGVIVLLVGEIVTGFFAREGLMRIREGESASYLEDLREVELAVVDFSDAEHDRVISVPGDMVAAVNEEHRSVSHPSLPFAIEVLEAFPNAQLLRRGQHATPADHGLGLEAMPRAVPTVRGVDGGEVDAPAAYVRLRHDGQELGTWLLSASFVNLQPVEVEGEMFGIALRYRRSYKPYSLELLDFRHDKFVGTEIARNFSSRVRLRDPEHGIDREALIRMNEPLRHAGATFYQSSYDPDELGTVLQVVENPGALLPYIASTMVTLGLLWHFGVMLMAALRRRETVDPATNPHAVRSINGWAIAAFLIGLLIASQALLRGPLPDDERLAKFAVLPVSAGGRTKPIDTAARHLVLLASGRQTVSSDAGTISATRFLIDLIARPEEVRELPVIRIDHPGILALLHLTPEDAGRRVSLALIEQHWSQITTQAVRASEQPSQERDSFQRAVLGLHRRVSEVLTQAAMEQPYAIPPLGPDGDWAPFNRAFAESADDQTPHPAVAYYVSMMTAYHDGDMEAFDRSVDGYNDLLERDMPEVMRRMRLEILFNRGQLFLGAASVYVLGFLILCGGILFTTASDDAASSGSSWRERTLSAGVALLWSALAIHTIALALRIVLQGRPPVTNLYSSAVFVGWAAVLFGLIAGRMQRSVVGPLAASVVGFATLVIAHHLGSDGDTMQMMQAVLDSNFWLATHVVAITLGYSASFLAGTLGAAWLIRRAWLRSTHPEDAGAARSLERMIYGSVGFSLLLSFVGTVLGGIWADQSWGRFWGWDPKENGAALVVLIHAIILHARWGGIVRSRGVAVLAVFGNIVTAWSWFGTNMLGVGLHSYGFMDKAVLWMAVFVISQLFLMSLALLPVRGAADPG